MYQVEALREMMELSQTTSLSAVKYFICLPCSEIGIRKSSHCEKDMEEKGSYGETFELFQKSTLESLLRVFCLACRYMLSILKVISPERSLFNIVDAFFF